MTFPDLFLDVDDPIAKHFKNVTVIDSERVHGVVSKREPFFMRVKLLELVAQELIFNNLSCIDPVGGCVLSCDPRTGFFSLHFPGHQWQLKGNVSLDQNQPVFKECKILNGFAYCLTFDNKEVMQLWVDDRDISFISSYRLPFSQIDSMRLVTDINGYVSCLLHSRASSKLAIIRGVGMKVFNAMTYSLSLLGTEIDSGVGTMPFSSNILLMDSSFKVFVLVLTQMLVKPYKLPKESILFEPISDDEVYFKRNNSEIMVLRHDLGINNILPLTKDIFLILHRDYKLSLFNTNDSTFHELETGLQVHSITRKNSSLVFLKVFDHETHSYCFAEMCIGDKRIDKPMDEDDSFASEILVEHKPSKLGNVTRLVRFLQPRNAFELELLALDPVFDKFQKNAIFSKKLNVISPSFSVLSGPSNTAAAFAPKFIGVSGEDLEAVIIQRLRLEDVERIFKPPLNSLKEKARRPDESTKGLSLSKRKKQDDETMSIRKKQRSIHDFVLKKASSSKLDYKELFLIYQVICSYRDSPDDAMLAFDQLRIDGKSKMLLAFALLKVPSLQEAMLSRLNFLMTNRISKFCVEYYLVKLRPTLCNISRAYMTRIISHFPLDGSYLHETILSFLYPREWHLERFLPRISFREPARITKNSFLFEPSATHCSMSSTLRVYQRHDHGFQIYSAFDSTSKTFHPKRVISNVKVLVFGNCIFFFKDSQIMNSYEAVGEEDGVKLQRIDFTYDTSNPIGFLANGADAAISAVSCFQSNKKVDILCAFSSLEKRVELLIFKDHDFNNVLFTCCESYQLCGVDERYLAMLSSENDTIRVLDTQHQNFRGGDIEDNNFEEFDLLFNPGSDHPLPFNHFFALIDKDKLHVNWEDGATSSFDLMIFNISEDSTLVLNRVLDMRRKLLLFAFRDPNQVIVARVSQVPQSLDVLINYECKEKWPGHVELIEVG